MNTMRKMLWDFHTMWQSHAQIGGHKSVTYEDLEEMLDKLEAFHYAELQRIEDKYRPATQADLNSILHEMRSRR